MKADDDGEVRSGLSSHSQCFLKCLLQATTDEKEAIQTGQLTVRFRCLFLMWAQAVSMCACLHGQRGHW